MSFGLFTKGNLNNTMFSEKTPSVVFMGKAVDKATYGNSYKNRGLTRASFYASSDTRKTYLHATSTKANLFSDGSPDSTSHDVFIDLAPFYGVYLTRYRTDNFRTAVYEVESFAKPVVFFHYTTPGTYGGTLYSVVDNGTTGPRGYANWDITVLLYYSVEGAYLASASDITLYCFSKIDPNYVSNTGSVLLIKDAVGGVMFHSDWKPAQIKGILDVDTSNSDYSTWTGSLTKYDTITKDIFMAKDSGRFVNYEGAVISGFDCQFEMHKPIIAYSATTGTGYTLHLGEMPVFQYNLNETKVNHWEGDGQMIIPIMDGSDYD